MSNNYQAWVSYGADVEDPKTAPKTHTLRAYISVPFVEGTVLSTGDGNGNTCQGKVIFIQDEIVTILLDPNTKSWA